MTKFVLPRALSMTFGRPSAIPESYVKLEMPDDHGFYPMPEKSLSSEARNSLNVPFYVATMLVQSIFYG